ncbi:unnamed protein product [Ectocarpus sp. CCAP 1310/34]|nr:unnamed protein product [Ectocarpus sp. CCAP 1310/34]
MVGVVVGAVAGALTLGALGFFLYRRRSSKSTDPDPPAPPCNGGDSLEHGRAWSTAGVNRTSNGRRTPIPIGGNDTLGPPPATRKGTPIPIGGNDTLGPPPATRKESPPPPTPYAHDGAHQIGAVSPPSPNRRDGGARSHHGRCVVVRTYLDR